MSGKHANDPVILADGPLPTLWEVVPCAMSYVLVVDDDDCIRETICDALRDAGYAVVQASTGQRALDRMRVLAPSVVLLDLMMPIVDGWEVVRQMQTDRRLAPIPICIVSSTRSNIPSSTGGVLYKPFAQAELLHAVGRFAHVIDVGAAS